jgi:hypothetical protein
MEVMTMSENEDTSYKLSVICDVLAETFGPPCECGHDKIDIFMIKWAPGCRGYCEAASASECWGAFLEPKVHRDVNGGGKAVIDHCKGIRKLGIPSAGGIQETAGGKNE